MAAIKFHLQHNCLFLLSAQQYLFYLKWLHKITCFDLCRSSSVNVYPEKLTKEIHVLNYVGCIVVLLLLFVKNIEGCV